MVDAALEVNKRLVVRFYDELWNRGNYDVADELVAADYVRHDLRPGDAPPGPAGQKAVAQRFRAAFPDVRLEIHAGRIAEIWNLRDDMGLREQVGATIYAGYPEDAER